MKQLPEKWAIKTDDPEFYEYFNNLPNVDKGMGYYYGIWDRNAYIHYPHYNTCGNELCYSNEDLKEGYEEITIEQWREAVQYEKELDHDTDSILPEDESKIKFIQETGELIGYEAPYDILVGFSKGHVVKISNKVDNRYGAYSEIPENGKMWFSAEWVERDWEPVYKAKEKKRVVKSGWVIQVIGGLGIPILDGSTSRPALFNTQADCIEWVKNNGMLEEFYTFLEVDYITEE